MLIFWNVYKTNGDYYPLYLNDSRGEKEDIYRFVKFEYLL